MALNVSPNGKMNRVVPANGKFTLKEIQKILNCHWIQAITQGKKVFIIDDDGLAKNLTVNKTASAIYWSECQSLFSNINPFVGNVLVCELNEVE